MPVASRGGSQRERPAAKKCWADRIVLLDPIRRNLTAAAGGGFFQMLVAHDKVRLFELQAMAHERVMDLLPLVARASREVA